MEIEQRMKDRRKMLGISAEMLAAAISVSPATIYRYESGDIEHMGVDKLTPIAKFLNTNEAYLMGWTDDPSPFLFKKASSEPALTSSEEILLAKFRELNGEGQDELIKQANLLIMSRQYIKNRQNKLVDSDASAINK